MGGHQSAAAHTDEWLTPPELLRALGPFDLDPCAPVVRPWPMAASHYTVSDDGLARAWSGRCFVNPPYGQATGAWLRLAARHADATALIFARTDTQVWAEWVWPHAHAILFVRGRIHFHYVDGTRAAQNGGAPSALVAYNQGNTEALASCGVPGQLVYLRHQPLA